MARALLLSCDEVKPPSGGTIKGMRLRTTPNYTPLFAALGVSQVQTPPGEVLTALEVMRSVIDHVDPNKRRAIDLTGLGNAFGAE